MSRRRPERTLEVHPGSDTAQHLISIGKTSATLRIANNQPGYDIIRAAGHAVIEKVRTVNIPMRGPLRLTEDKVIVELSSPANKQFMKRIELPIRSLR